MNPEFALDLVWIAWFASWIIAAAWSSRPAAKPRLRRELEYRVITAIGGYLLFFPRALIFQAASWSACSGLGWIMVAVVLAGLAFTWWARLHLGLLWSSGITRKPEHQVIDSGPYRVVRHPIYTGLILAVIATAVIRGRLQGIVGVVLVIAGFVIKARLEEQFLREQLGGESYGAYAGRTPMLLPLPRRRPS